MAKKIGNISIGAFRKFPWIPCMRIALGGAK